MTAARVCARCALAAALVAGCSKPPAEARPGEPARDPGGTTMRAEKLTVVTYNVLADASGAAERLPSLLAALRDCGADVFAFQEAARWFVDALLAEAYLRSAYSYPVRDGSPFVPGGLFVLTKFPVRDARARALPGGQGRAALAVRLEVEGRSLAVGVVHLESFLDAGAVRAAHLDAVFPMIEDAADAILAGDFNFGDGEPEERRLDARFVDAWKAVRPGESGFTWDVERSEMALRGSFPGERSRRLDRVLVRSALWRPREARIIGDEPVAAGRLDLFPSDHFGLAVTLVRREAR